MMHNPGWSALARRAAWPLVAGDTLAFIVFAALGHKDHGETTSLLAIVGTAAPFIAGWLAVAPWAGAYTSALASRPAAKPLLLRTAIAWICAWPVALLLRALVLQRGIPLSFAVVALLFNALILLGWRGLYAFLSGRVLVRPA